MRASLTSLVPAILAATYVSGHGIVESITVAGKTFAGLNRGESGARGSSVIRQVQNNSPVPGVTSQFMACGANGAAASASAPANPGDRIGFQWSKSWPHLVGPIVNYMASCGSAGCESFNAANAHWFKIDQQGIRGDGKWAQADIQAGNPSFVTIPPNLAPGNYLIRHEIIALHNAITAGGAEFYPACAQVKVGGSGTGSPSSDELVRFPGAYNANDPGILVNVFGGVSAATYRFPGPAISKLAGSSSAPPAPVEPPATTAAPTTGGTAPAVSPTSPGSVVTTVTSSTAQAVTPTGAATTSLAASPTVRTTSTSRTRRMSKTRGSWPRPTGNGHSAEHGRPTMNHHHTMSALGNTSPPSAPVPTSHATENDNNRRSVAGVHCKKHGGGLHGRRQHHGHNANCERWVNSRITGATHASHY